MNTTLDAVDHLLFAAADLERGADAVERLLGQRPVPGGRHPLYGTHNALLSLGPKTYLEVIAPDPGLEVPARGMLFDAHELGQPRRATWVLRTEAIEEVAARAVAAGVGLGPVEPGSREKPDGSVLAWKITDPYAMPLDGAVPFLISWGETPHPAQATPGAAELVALR